MPPRERDEGLFTDMLTSAREAWEFCYAIDLERFMSDRKLCLAVERCLEIIGEAASQLSEEARAAHPEIPWQRIRGLRNVLAHDYGNIEYETLYKIVTDELPPLRAALEAILGKMQGIREVCRSPYAARRWGLDGAWVQAAA